MANLVPLNLSHKLTRDTVIRGNFLPKGTVIVPQISAVLNDGQVAARKIARLNFYYFKIDFRASRRIRA
jgi:hypothetical protein